MEGAPLPVGPGARIPANIAKIAVKFFNDDITKLAQMVAFDKTRPLTAFISDLCTPWSLENPGDFALQFGERRNSSLTYVTEKNRGEIKNGIILVLCPSAEKNAASIVSSIEMGDAQKKKQALLQLSLHASDVTFAQEFINQSGVNLLISIIEGGGWNKSPQTASLTESTATILGSFLDLMDHAIVSWDIVDQAFINKIASYVNTSKCDPAVVESSLAILECLLVNSTKQVLIHKEISPPHLFERLRKNTPGIQQNALSFINAILGRAENDTEREKLALGIQSQATRNAIMHDVIPAGHTITPEIARQVSVLQSHLMKVIHQRLQMGRFDTDASEKQILDLRKVTSSVLAEVPLSPALSRKGSEAVEELNRLGIQNSKSPLEDFSIVPEGSLVLDCMHYFAVKNTDAFRQWVLESFSRETSDCSFFIASVEVVRILAETFRVGLPADQGEQYDSIIFSTDAPFEESYCLAMNTLNKTWKEMKATNQDFPKVMGVLKEQINSSLRDPPPPTTIDDWKSRIKGYNYIKINKIRGDRKNTKEELESKAEPIVQLREKLRPEILGLIAENRIRYMQKGGRFAHRERGGGFRFGDKRQSWCCRLSTNHKLLHYGDFEDNSRVPNTEELQNVVAVTEIESLLTGKECPHVKSKKSSSSSLAFSLVMKGEKGEKKSIDFIALNEKDFHMWIDGVHHLLGKQMTSPLAASDLENLLTWEIKLRLMGTEGITIPEKTDVIPSLPANFEYCLRLN